MRFILKKVLTNEKCYSRIRCEVLKVHGTQYSSLAQSVEHSAVNRVVVGSSPTGGVETAKAVLHIRLLGQAVKTSPFHGGNTGSIPVGVIWRHSQAVRRGSATP